MYERLYVPAALAVIAVQWDGREETATYLNVIAGYSKYTTMVLPDGTLMIDSMTDQRGSYSPVDVGDWLITQSLDGPFRVLDDTTFRSSYIRVYSGTDG